MQVTTQLGILGGGQLSMMLIHKAQALGFRPSHLCGSLSDPASQVSPNSIIGDPQNAQDLKAFSKNIDILTFESEFYNASYLMEQLKDFKGYIFPSLKVLQTLQDRKTQKESFIQNKLPTSPFLCCDNQSTLTQFFKDHGALVAKQRWNGYDGYGTYVLNSKSQFDFFLQKHSLQLNNFIFEKLIRFEYEVAVQASRSRKGHIVFFPFVKSIQKDNKCFLVEGPEKPYPDIQNSILRFLNKIDYVGTIGFEFFKTKSGLILNEVAPRVHNTGHHTLDSCNVDQFTMHWLCALQNKLPEVSLKSKAFVMLNLIGKRDVAVKIPDQLSGSLFWYGKSNRKGRKLGHINYTGENKKALASRALRNLKDWTL